MRQSILFMLLLSLFVFFVTAEYDISEDCDDDSTQDWFNIKIRATGNKYITINNYQMDIKHGTFGFNRTGATIFEGYINGTEKGNSYLVTRDDGFGYLLEDEAPLYDFFYSLEIPPTEFKGNWSIEGGFLACHELTDGFKYFPESDGGYVIRWDTRKSGGYPLLMVVD
ncbi:uncharacterized protein LAJ45_10412 [Morchella importuna]|uniref:uncharacterized protein n=1 Tax=Morchella importuna TaxID=1174673 RepID=UPI001E8D2D74|nr:uncharacterized protein LAJ45_10412 [Morchella importuna]KAH8145611.1 hypothetical protein LAJ45_10412 [Morchella importuna]